MAGITVFTGTTAGTSSVMSPSAARNFFMKRHATTTSQDERDQIEIIAGVDFSFQQLTPDEMVGVADGMQGDRPTVDEASDASIAEMAQARLDNAEIEEADAKKLKQEQDAEQKALLAKRSVGQKAPTHDPSKAFGSGMTERGTMIGTEFSRRR